ncbi:MAG: hypothetical protein CMF74_02390 [Maricaulis sp.]|nr:hypothetical protein [Maricaulis sp.]HAQ35709.1 hypothetical protein [Alphaproteobacteria bacterium]
MFGGFTFLVDPYGLMPDVQIPGVNERRTRAHEDGYRVRTGHRLLTTQAGTIIMGSSRVADGFPRDLPDWPGGWENLGMAGTTAFELARASTLAAQNENIHCVVIGMDLREFGTYPNAHATYWITPLAGGPRLFADIRMLLSPSAFARAMQTFTDNLTGGSDTRWEHAYDEDILRERFEDEISKRYRGYGSYEYDPERVRFLFRGIDALLAEGKQVAVFIHPVHVWQEEAGYRAGVNDQEYALRRDAVAQLNARTPGEAEQPCFDGPALQLWDFGGYQPVSLTAPPDWDGNGPNPWYYVPAHYRPTLGQAVLDRLRGLDRQPPVNADQFGYRLDGETLDTLLAAREARREAWLSSGEEWMEYVTGEFDALDANPPDLEREARHYLNRDNWNQLERDVRQIERD